MVQCEIYLIYLFNSSDLFNSVTKLQEMRLERILLQWKDDDVT